MYSKTSDLVWHTQHLRATLSKSGLHDLSCNNKDLTLHNDTLSGLHPVISKQLVWVSVE